MHFPALLAGLAAFSTTVTAIPAEKPHVGVAILTVNEPEDSTLPLNVPLGVLTHQKNNKLTELEFVNVYSTVKGVKPPKMDQIRCQMYKDQYGTVPITKDLTAENGVVSKKPIYLGWVLCRVKAQK
ncbi:hypothetical protein FGLOB1_10049 [Fusarium globosum]|uniref:Uncharacterized protein n=3 Tax=Fusarium fujikuroi species complex TaxID=171627 RepID=A0A8H5XXA3_9HYPO|nr:hypothetical protein FGLOB1_10049 [Fusarium globosum]KLO80201.1 uncharacterized protein LW93_6398 [Fusarium fujikuroi]SCV38983.1 uncharacterized protein FFB14_07062 [Fusarium fujikuroi]